MEICRILFCYFSTICEPRNLVLWRFAGLQKDVGQFIFPFLPLRLLWGGEQADYDYYCSYYYGKKMAWKFMKYSTNWFCYVTYIFMNYLFIINYNYIYNRCFVNICVVFPGFCSHFFLYSLIMHYRIKKGKEY